jgi:hypothetical protein
MTTAQRCLFCQLAAADIVAENACHVVIRDRFPVSLGHSLIIPKRHVASLFEVTAEEFNALRPSLTLSLGSCRFLPHTLASSEFLQRKRKKFIGHHSGEFALLTDRSKLFCFFSLLFLPYSFPLFCYDFH